MVEQLQRYRWVCGVIPPYILDNIARYGKAKQREAALRTKAVDSTFRAIRLATQGSRYAPHRLAAPFPMAAAQEQRTIYNANHLQDLPGEVVRTEGQDPTKDEAVNEAYDGLGATFDFFQQVYGRNSIDDRGMKLDGVVLFDKDYNNAFWNSAQMVFGDGDGEIFNRFTRSLDIIGHELTHGVTEVEAQLQYFKQPGALNESMSDVFGSLVKQFAKKQQADQADWLIGAEILTPKVKGMAIRSMKDPGSAFDDAILGKDLQPKHMDQYVDMIEDNGGIHINSGIPNHAFYQVAIRLGGFAWEKAGRIWYETLRDADLKPDTDFLGLAKLTHLVAGRLYTANSPEQQAVREGWAVVGLSI